LGLFMRRNPDSIYYEITDHTDVQIGNHKLIDLLIFLL
jgi:hypothetical protein